MLHSRRHGQHRLKVVGRQVQPSYNGVDGRLRSDLHAWTYDRETYDRLQVVETLTSENRHTAGRRGTVPAVGGP